MASKSTATGLGLAIGVAIGTAIGAALGHIGPWLAIGAGIGLLIPSHWANPKPLSQSYRDKH